MNIAADNVTVSTPNLQHALTALFTNLGMTQDNARQCAADMVLTNLWGIDSHGVLRLPIYVQRLEANVIKANPDISTCNGRSSFEVMDGDRGMGYVVGHHAMNRAIELARQSGIGAVTVRNSNHYGAAALYARQATQAGLIGISMTNVTPNLVVPGGSKPITGNNPLAFGAPTNRGFPLMLDISMSAVAGGKLLLASEKGEKIPLDWATDRNGRPTDDPDAGFEGFLLPLGGHKGFGLSLMIDILCGIISGGAHQFDIKSMYGSPDASSKTGHMMIAIDPTIAMQESDFLDRMDAFYETIKSSPMWDSTKKMYIPGEIENETRLARQRDGIPLTASLLSEVNDILQRHQIEPLLPTA